jgi:16S rRNA (cytosine967-C5)-methyltransferase
MTSTRSSPPQSARRLALRVIRRVTEEGAYSNIALSSALSGSGLEDRDRRFAAELVYGTLRRARTLDRAIEAAARRPLAAIDAAALATLRLGAYQLMYTRVPPHAGVSETVALADPRARGFVNAVLRRISSAAPEIASADALADPAPGADADLIAEATGLATWAVSELGRILPPDEVGAAAAALAEPAGLTLRANRARTDAARLASRLAEHGLAVSPARHHADVLLVSGPALAPSDLPGFDDGWFAVQDEASVIVGAAVGVQPGERVLDACAGPGGKAAHLAASAGTDGTVIAADVSVRRAALVGRTARRLGVELDVLAQDARTPALPDRRFDAVLVDAPCSGLGAARRRPELLWRVPKERLASLARLQVAILLGVAPLVRPGGRLVYSVCTYPRAETDAAVRAFLAKRQDFVPAQVPGPDGPAETHRLWPHRHGTDGMFYAGFTREGPGPG